jgi:prophage maintenance system killer protein
LTAAVVFLRLNGYVLDAPDSEEFAEVIVAVITGKISERDFIEALSRNAVRPIDDENDDFPLA